MNTFAGILNQPYLNFHIVQAVEFLLNHTASSVTREIKVTIYSEKSTTPCSTRKKINKLLALSFRWLNALRHPTSDWGNSEGCILRERTS